MPTRFEKSTYKPDYVLHGEVEICLTEELMQREPSLTLCSLNYFERWAGGISHAVLHAVKNTSSFHRIAQYAASDSSFTLRVSTYTIWLDELQTPTACPFWHVDRLGDCKIENNQEYLDLADPLGFPSFMIVSMFLPDRVVTNKLVDAVSTELIIEPIEREAPFGWSLSALMHSDIERAFAKNPNLKTINIGNKRIAALSPNTIHRAGTTEVPGWRYLFRLGLYSNKTRCSLYEDHFVFHNALFDKASNQVAFREIGQKHAIYVEPRQRSMPLSSISDSAANICFKKKLNILFGHN